MDLSKIKYEFPDFCIDSFHMFDTIICLKWENVFDDKIFEEHKNITLEMSNHNNYKIIMECLNVHTFHFDGNGQISGFCIEDMSTKGYESCSKYKVGDYEEHCIGFYCSEIIIKSFDKNIK